MSHDDLMRYLDGELPAERRQAVAVHLEACTECNREFIVFRAMKGDLQNMLTNGEDEPSLWNAINRRLMRPAGWVLLVTGAVALTVWGAWSYVTSPESFWEKLAVGAVVIGLVLLLVSAILDRLHDLKTDPYREIQR